MQGDRGFTQLVSASALNQDCKITEAPKRMTGPWVYGGLPKCRRVSYSSEKIL